MSLPKARVPFAFDEQCWIKRFRKTVTPVSQDNEMFVWSNQNHNAWPSCNLQEWMAYAQDLGGDMSGQDSSPVSYSSTPPLRTGLVYSNVYSTIVQLNESSPSYMTPPDFN